VGLFSKKQSRPADLLGADIGHCSIIASPDGAVYVNQQHHHQMEPEVVAATVALCWGLSAFQVAQRDHGRTEAERLIALFTRVAEAEELNTVVDLDQYLAEVLTSPLMCRRAVYRWRQMLRDGELHRDGWRDLIAPTLGLAEAIECRARGDGREKVDLPHDHGRPRRGDELTFSRDQFAREIRWLISQADADPWDWERQNLREFLRALATVLPQMERYYDARRMTMPFNQLVIAADAVHWARAQ
jgi:hypothetical protein